MRICFIGDSFVNGTGDDDCLGWPGRLCSSARQAGLDVTYYNLGIRRDTSADIALRWQREASARLPPEQDGRVVFSFGVNDCVEEGGQRRVAEPATLANTRAILAQALAAGWPTLVVGPPCTGEPALDASVQRLSGEMEALCRALGVAFLPIFAPLLASELWRHEAQQGDGIHPGRGGYARIANLVEGWQPWREWLVGGRGFEPR